MVKTIKGREVIWEGLKESCQVEDKTFKSLTFELNKMFRKYNINKCIQKITFLAQVNAETGFFSISHEELSKYLSSKSKYKGRGLIQLTGNLNKAKTSYDDPGPYKEYGKYIGDENKFINNPNLIATDLHYTVDSSGWEWSVSKKALPYTKDYKNASKNADAKWKRETFPKGVGKTLNEIALAYEETGEEKYFWFQSKILNGYSLSDRNSPDPHGWSKRKEGLRKLKQWFKYDKNICNGEKELDYVEEDEAPWIPFAKEELKKYGGIRQIHSPLKEKVVEYFKVAKAAWYDHTGFWCGAFVRWCFAQTKDYNYVFDSYNSVTAFNWLPKEQAQQRNSKMIGCSDLEHIEDIKDIFVGSIIVFDFSHVAFVIGQSQDEKQIYYLGGNQSDKAPGDGKGKRTICIGKISKSEINKKFWLSKPKKYQPKKEEKQLPKLKVTAYELDYSSSR